MRVHVARQPIFNRKLTVYGYELLYRNHENDVAFASGFDGTVATSRVILESFFGLGFERFTGRRKAFINFTSDLLDSEVATLFPPDKLVIEVLEDVEADEHVIEKCRALRRMGYEIALDDFVMRPDTAPLLNVADIVKVDFLSTPHQHMEELIKRSPRRIKFLAEKIESRSAYNTAREMGFQYFQGYFLNRPETFTSDDLSPLRVNYINLIRYLNQADFRMDKVEQIIRQDVALSFKLLRLVNSVAFGMRYRIRSVHHALVILGQEETRKWITLLSMMSLDDRQNEALLQQSLIRAKFAEGMARRVYPQYDDNIDSMFMLGLFSLLDALVQRPYKDIFSKIEVVDEKILEALIDGEGEFKPYLDIVTSYEQGQIEEAIATASSLGVDSEAVAEDYQNALAWCITVFEDED